MTPIKVLFAAFAALLAGLGPAADAGIVYGVTYLDNQLISIDTTTGAGTLVGTFATPLAGYGLADVNNKFYTFDSNADVIRQIDPTSAAILATTSIGLSPGALLGQGGMAFQSATVGFLTSALDPTTYNPVNSLYRFDMSTGKSVNLVPNGGTSDTLEALAFGAGGVLYGLGKGDGNLFTVNTTSGALTLIGNAGFGVGGTTGGLAFAPNGVLYATIDDALYTLNTTNGLATAVGIDPATGLAAPTGFYSISGLATVPEPSSLLLCGIAAALAGGCRLARRRKAADETAAETAP